MAQRFRVADRASGDGFRRRGPRQTAFAALLAGLLMGGLVACGSSGPSAATLLSQAKAHFDSAQTFHFQLQTQHPGSAPTATNFYPTGAEGDVDRATNAFKALVSVALAGNPVSIQVIGIGAQGWYQNPLTNQYVKTDSLAPLTKLFDPTTGLGSLLTDLTNVSQPSDRTINGTPCWYISGSLPAADLAPVVVGVTPPAQAIPMAVCVDKKTSQLDYLSVTGPLIAGDASNTEHDVSFSHYGESINIQPPTTP